jgi:hypothetical protein
MRFFTAGPALYDFTIRYPPNDNPAKCNALIGGGIRAGPVIADHHAVVFRDQVLHPDMHIGESFISSAHILLRSHWAWSRSGRHLRAMIDEFRGKIHVGDIQILLVHKLLKVVAHKIFHLLEG